MGLIFIELGKERKKGIRATKTVYFLNVSRNSSILFGKCEVVAVGLGRK